jgi:hypothetical protein
MRKIEILEDVRLRFPGRDAEFDLGLEVGAVSVLLAQGISLIQRELSHEAAEQLRPLAQRFGYTLVAADAPSGMLAVTLAHRSRRPMLRVV